ncbi:autophagy-related protein ATG9 [Acrasis kona]|uniref:Autophagy-related protein 9 n=1 Tax=Acrasis kona TaxID=1008807 RepID=A0AAW2YWF1_9EUKA
MSSNGPQYLPLDQHDSYDDYELEDDNINNETSLQIEELESRTNDADGSLIDSGHNQRESLGIDDLDQFFKRVYSFYKHKGFWCLFAYRTLKLINVLFVIGFTSFLSILVNWQQVWNCKDQETCNAASKHLIRENYLKDLAWWRILIITFELAMLSYWLFRFVQFIIELYNMYYIKIFYERELNLSDRELQTIKWHEVVEKIELLQKTKSIYINGELTAIDITNRIMRKDNYLIAFVNMDILNLRIPIPFLNKRFVLTQSLVWNLRYAISSLFGADFKIKNVQVKELKNMFRLLGFLNFIASPFIFFFLLVYTFFKYSAQIKNDPVAIIERKWSTLARWKFRDFNELQHVFEERLKEAYAPATKYVDQFPSHLLSIFGRSVMFLGSSFAAVIIVLSFVKSPTLLYLTFFDQTLIWWLGILLLVYGTSRSVVIEEHRVFAPDTFLQETCLHIHYCPPNWKGLGHHQSVRDEFESLFPVSLLWMLQEMSSILITPLILFFSLPDSAEGIIDFVNKKTVKDPNVGDICRYSTFNFSYYGDVRYGSMPQATDENEPRCWHGKMEISYLNFSMTHPNWIPPKEYGTEVLRENLTKSLHGSTTSTKPTAATTEYQDTISPPTPDTATTSSAGVNAQTMSFDDPSPLPNSQFPFEKNTNDTQNVDAQNDTKKARKEQKETRQESPRSNQMYNSTDYFNMLGSYFPSKSTHRM